MKFTPHAYQRLAINRMVERTHMGLFLDPGLGKTAIVLSAFTQWHRIGAERMLVIAPLAVCLNVWPQEVAKWDHTRHLSVGILHGRRKADVLKEDHDIYVINPEGVPWLVEQSMRYWPDMLVVDECFPSGTPIATPSGDRPIEKLQVGDVILSSDGPRRIRRVFQGQSQILITLELTDGRKIETTPGHPFLTCDGWQPASALQAGMGLCELQEGVRGPVSNGREASQVLFEAVRRESETGSTELECGHTNEASIATEAIEIATYDGASPENSSQTSDDRTRKTHVSRVGGRVDMGAPCDYSSKRQIPGLLSDRCIRSQTENCDRTGWAQPSKSQGARPTARRLPSFVRVASISISQRRDPVAVFNLEIEGLPHYIANGLVVHNSTKFKKPGTKRFRALRKILGQFSWRYILTGTPTPNGLLDLFGQIYVVDQGHTLGRSLIAYKQEHFVPIPRGNWSDWVPRRNAETLIREKIRPVVLRLEGDGLDLPDLVVTPVRVTLPPLARQRYDRLKADMVLELEQGEISAQNGGALTGKCRQAANGRLYLDDAAGAAPMEPDGMAGGRGFVKLHDAKAEALGRLVEELGGKRVLIAYEFNHDLDGIRQALGDVPILKGGDPAMVTAWNRRQLPAMAIHPKSAGHGLNLQAGGHVLIWYSLTWDLELYQQTVCRIYRQGQTERVLVYQLMADDTVDETVARCVQRKDTNQRALLAALREDLEW